MKFLWVLVLCCLNVPYIFAQEDSLSIISPHRQSLQREMVDLFKVEYKKKYGNEIQVEWIDQGGSENDIRFIKAKFEKNPKSSSIDIFWGGGDVSYYDLENEGRLEKITVAPEIKQNLPENLLGIPLKSKNDTWYATAISSFGIFYNKKLINLLKLQEPKTWEDLADPKFYGHVSLSDPRRSSTALLMDLIMIHSLGWDKSWEVLTGLAGNTKKFTHSSSDPIKAVVSGDSATAITVDFYAAAQVEKLGKQNLAFVMPEGKTIFNADPIAILKGAPHRKEADRFVNFALSQEAQRLLVLTPGSKEGPRQNLLGRMAVTPKAYEVRPGNTIISINPFTLKSNNATLSFDAVKMSHIKNVISDLIAAFHIDTHTELRKAWEKAIKQNSAKMFKELAQPPISQKEIEELAKKWDDQVFRNKIINSWIEMAQKKYQAALGSST